MSAATTTLQEAVIQQYSKQLRLPTLGGQFARLAMQAIKEKQGHPLPGSVAAGGSGRA